jgi:asparagine synthase (glutamine-hydrolysing)
MAHSVEGRFPFLDYRVVEFTTALPSVLKMKVLNEKYLLKRCAGHLVPKSIAQRPKQPVRAPGAECFFGPATPDYVDEMLSPRRLRDSGIFNVIAVQTLLEKFRRGRAIGTKDNMAIVAILSTQLLVHQFLEQYEQQRSTDGTEARRGSEATEDTAVHYR